MSAFIPSAYLIGTRAAPSQITIFGVTGGTERWLRIPLDLTKPPVNYAAQCLVAVRRTPLVPFWGDAIGFWINFVTDHAVRFDLNGAPVERSEMAYRPGATYLSIRNHDVTGIARIVSSS